MTRNIEFVVGRIITIVTLLDIPITNKNTLQNERTIYFDLFGDEGQSK